MYLILHMAYTRGISDVNGDVRDWSTILNTFFIYILGQALVMKSVLGDWFHVAWTFYVATQQSCVDCVQDSSGLAKTSLWW